MSWRVPDGRSTSTERLRVRRALGAHVAGAGHKRHGRGRRGRGGASGAREASMGGVAGRARRLPAAGAGRTEGQAGCPPAASQGGAACLPLSGPAPPRPAASPPRPTYPPRPGHLARARDGGGAEADARGAGGREGARCSGRRGSSTPRAAPASPCRATFIREGASRACLGPLPLKWLLTKAPAPRAHSGR